jgi:3-deoxy-7-phosphoheptulonate synthase
MNTPKLKNCSAEVKIGKAVFGNGAFDWIAGPCAVESLEQMRRIADILHNNGIKVMRGGLFKPRTSPYAFQGLHEQGVEIIRSIKAEFDLAFISEVLDGESLKILLPVLDAIQIGSRNCLNYALLEKVAPCGKPVMLKRGFSVTLDEWLNAAEYLALHGCQDIIFCERGIRTITECTRFTLDVGAIAYLKAHWGMPVMADPSHAAGVRELVAPLAFSAVAAGADGLILEVSDAPEEAKCDAKQQIIGSELQQIKQTASNLRACIL